MAIGGWMSGLAFDLTGSYRMAVVNGMAWNMVTIVIAGWLVLRRRGGRGWPTPEAGRRVLQRGGTPEAA